MKAKKTKVTLYGDTIVEAVVAIAIYSIVAVLSLSLMSSGISTAQRNLESTMSRAVIDSESELLRYYYESYLASQSNKNDDARYAKIWEKIKPKDGTKDGTKDGSTKVEPSELYYEEPGSTEKYNTCDDLINHDKAQLEAIPGSGAISIYALSGRGALSTFKKNINYYGIGKMNNNTAYESLQLFGADQIVTAPLYPRLTYKNMSISGNTIGIVSEDTATDFLGGAGGKADGKEYYQSRVSYRAEGVWIFPKRTDKGYDFYVRTCWNPVGSNTPSTFMSVVRLYDAGV